MGNCISTDEVGGSLSLKVLIFKRFCCFLDTHTLLCYDFSSASADILIFFSVYLKEIAKLNLMKLNLKK